MSGGGRQLAATPQLRPLALTPLPLGSIRPSGWLFHQLRLQSDGLTGHLDEFWPDVGPNSAWLGGTGEDWERGPYYLDGLVPLAFLLDDETLQEKARRWIESILAAQREDGWFGPASNPDPWPRMVVLKALTQYQEATDDPRIPSFLSRYFLHQLDSPIDLPPDTWRGVRFADQVVSIYWLYQRTGDTNLLELARRQFKAGFDWADWFVRFPFKEKVHREQAQHENHGVNVAMALKHPALRYRLTHREEDRKAVYAALEQLDRYHGQASGMFSADEHLAGRNPSQGTELCAVVETLFSLENMIPILGDAGLCDRLEQIGYNALPATLTADLWAHQYDQQANQVLCTVAERQWVNNGPASNIFGLEPNFGCCTANLHQGWPKLVSHLWMATPDQGLAAAVYGPCTVKTRVGGDAWVTISEETDYPFDGNIRLRLEMEQPVDFPLWLRIPSWAGTAEIRINSQPADPAPGTNGFQRIRRVWNTGDEIEIRFDMDIRTEFRGLQAVCVKRGPLVLALKIEEDWAQVGGEAPHADWEVKPLSPWNYGVVVSPDGHVAPEAVSFHPPGPVPFLAGDAPVVVKVKGKQIPGWGLYKNSADSPPAKPIKSGEPETLLTLIPYGCARLRITEFPFFDPKTAI